MDTDIEKFIAQLDPEQELLCRKIHELVVSNLPGAYQRICHSVPGYSFSDSCFDRIVYIMPQSKWINLGFFFGADIPDPKKLLTGDGVRMRHIKITNEKQINDPAVKKILKTAWAKAPADMLRIHKKKK